MHRIASRQRNSCNVRARAWPFAGIASQKIPILTWRICPDDKEAAGCREALVAGACRKNKNVSCFEVEFFATLSAELDENGAGGNPQYLMGGRMVVMEIINAVPPLRYPMVYPKETLERGGGIGDVSLQGAAIDEHGQARIVRYRTVIGEADGERFPHLVNRH